MPFGIEEIFKQVTGREDISISDLPLLVEEYNVDVIAYRYDGTAYRDMVAEFLRKDIHTKHVQAFIDNMSLLPFDLQIEIYYHFIKKWGNVNTYVELIPEYPNIFKHFYSKSGNVASALGYTDDIYQQAIEAQPSAFDRWWPIQIGLIAAGGALSVISDQYVADKIEDAEKAEKETGQAVIVNGPEVTSYDIEDFIRILLPASIGGLLLFIVLRG